MKRRVIQSDVKVTHSLELFNQGKADVLITNIKSIPKGKDLVIMDEAHYLKPDTRPDE